MNSSLKGNTKNNSNTFFTNTSALFFIQIASYILPFLLIPYLTRILGTDIFGIAAFGLSIVQISSVITDYGFNLSATYDISRHRDNELFVNKTIAAVFTCKSIILLVVLSGIIIFTLFDNKYETYTSYFLFLTLPVLGQTFQPIWLFQGIERMVPITIYTILSRILYLGLVVLFVTSPEDLKWVAISNGIAHIIAAVVGIALVYKLGFRPIWPGWNFIKTSMVNSTEYFWSRAALSTFTSGGAFFLGLFSTPLQIAYYSAAEQIYRGAQSLFAPVSQALYPHMVQHRNFSLFFKVIKVAIAICVLGSLIGSYLADWVVSFVFGSGFEGSGSILIVFLVALTANAPSVLLGYPFLGALGQNRLANRSVILAGLIQIFLLTFCYFMKFTTGFYVACTVSIIEIAVLSLRVFWSRKLYIGRYIN